MISVIAALWAVTAVLFLWLLLGEEIWKRVPRPAIRFPLPEHRPLHITTCKWCWHVRGLIRQARKDERDGVRDEWLEVALELAMDAKCDRARGMAYEEDKRRPNPY